MTALHKFPPCDHEDQFHVDRFDAFSTFIDALNAPVPELFNDPGFVSKPFRERGPQTVIPSVTAEGQQ